MDEIIECLKQQLSETGADYAEVTMTLKSGYVFKCSLEMPVEGVAE